MLVSTACSFDYDKIYFKRDIFVKIKMFDFQLKILSDCFRSYRNEKNLVRAISLRLKSVYIRFLLQFLFHDLKVQYARKENVKHCTKINSNLLFQFVVFSLY